MTLLIDAGIQGWFTDDELREAIRPYAPNLDLRIYSEDWNSQEIRMIAVSRLRPDLPARLPNLELVQKLGAGVETIVAHPALPDHVRVARLKPEAPAREIAEYCLAYVLREQRNMRFHEAEQRAGRWNSIAARENNKTTVGVLGLGHIGGYTAELFRDFGFKVAGWSRGKKTLDGIETFHGDAGLRALLAKSDHVAAILPSTEDTRGLFNAKMFAAMKPGSTFILPRPNCPEDLRSDQFVFLERNDPEIVGNSVAKIAPFVG